jgi:hypothetical protein
MNAKTIIEEIFKLDLSQYPYTEVKSLLQQLKRFSIVRIDLHPGKTLIRARVNDDGQRFSTRNELSYKPASYNKSFQRASTPNQTMFYAGSMPEKKIDGEVDNARIISTLEAANLLRDKTADGEQTITFSKSEVIKDIPLELLLSIIKIL